MDHYHGGHDASPEQLGEYVCPNGHPFPSPVAVSCTCGARVSCVPLSEALAISRQLDTAVVLSDAERSALCWALSITKTCDQCGRVGTRGFKTIPANHEGKTDGIQSFTVCARPKACRKRWPAHAR